MEITDSRRIFFYCNHDGLYGIDIAKDPSLLPEKVITSARLQRPCIKRSKAMGACTAAGKLQFRLTGVSKKKFKKYFKVNAGNGKITIRKGLKKGTYKLKISVTAAGNGNYLPSEAQVKVTVKVK